MSNLGARIATAAVGIPLVLFLNYVGGGAFAVAIGAAALVGVWELNGLLRSGGYVPVLVVALLGAACAAIAPLFVRSPDSVFSGVMLVVLGASGTWMLLPGGDEKRLVNWCLTITSVLYVGVLLGQLSVLRSWDRGAWWVVLAFVLTWAYDTGAYFSGRTFGKRPFMHHISSKKTVEGVQGGLALSACAGLLAVPALGLAVWQALLLGFVSGIAAQTGDLVESMIKRQVNVKDSGTIVPGHGGLLDRIDSLLFTAAVTVYAARAFGYGA